MYEPDGVKQIYIIDLICLFKFLLQLPENQYFANRYKEEINLKDKILKTFMKELNLIRSEILKNQRKMTTQSHESVKCKLYSFENLENIALNDGTIKEQLN